MVTVRSRSGHGQVTVTVTVMSQQSLAELVFCDRHPHGTVLRTGTVHCVPSHSESRWCSEQIQTVTLNPEPYIQNGNENENPKPKP